MKYIKLYESFNLNSDEVVNDIKSITYILEDNGYDIKFLTKEDVMKRNTFLELEEGEPDFDIKLTISCLNLLTNPPGQNSVILHKFNEDINHFLVMLKEHLDYVSDIELDSINFYFPKMRDITIKL